MASESFPSPACPICSKPSAYLTGLYMHLKQKHPCKWQIEDRGMWQDMDNRYQKKFEASYRTGSPEAEFTHKYGRERRSSYQYHIRFDLMTQTNLTTSTVRKIRRVPWQELWHDISWRADKTYIRAIPALAGSVWQTTNLRTSSTVHGIRGATRQHLL